MEMLKIKRALLSVTNKDGLKDLASFLHKGGVEIVSTGGTKRVLESYQLPVTSVSEVTGFPEILDGRVKTLHPHIHAGILADKENSEHLAVLERLKIPTFDLICVNLYDFKGAVRRGLKGKDLIEEIDIGGPTLLRAAAKNYHCIAVVPSIDFYPEVIKELEKNEFHISLALRKKMAAETFRITSEYDQIVYNALVEEGVQP